MAAPVGNTALAFARLWHVVDARGQVLGHLSRGIRTTLMGQHKPIYAPSGDCGDYVVVINAKHVVVSGNKQKHKMYRHHTGYPGGLKEIPYFRMMERHPEEIVRRAVYGMLPKNKLRPRFMNRLKIFPDDKHPYTQNLAKYLEDPALSSMSAAEWERLSAEEMLQLHEQQQMERLHAIFQKYGSTSAVQ